MGEHKFSFGRAAFWTISVGAPAHLCAIAGARLTYDIVHGGMGWWAVAVPSVWFGGALFLATGAVWKEIQLARQQGFDDAMVVANGAVSEAASMVGRDSAKTHNTEDTQ